MNNWVNLETAVKHQLLEGIILNIHSIDPKKVSSIKGLDKYLYLGAVKQFRRFDNGKTTLRTYICEEFVRGWLWASRGFTPEDIAQEVLGLAGKDIGEVGFATFWPHVAQVYFFSREKESNLCCIAFVYSDRTRLLKNQIKPAECISFCRVETELVMPKEHRMWTFADNTNKYIDAPRLVAEGAFKAYLL